MTDRTLSHFEKCFLRLSDVSPINIVAIACLRGPLCADDVREAINAVANRHPLLRVRVERTKAETWFRTEGVPEIPVEFVDALEKDIPRIVEREISTPIPTDTGPLIQCILARHSSDHHSLLVAVHHVIVDGAAVVVTIRDVVRYLATKLGNGAAVEVERGEIPLAMDDRLPESVRDWQGTRKLFRFVTGEILKNVRHGQPVPLRCDVEDTTDHGGKRVFFNQLDSDFVRALNQKARAMKTTQHGALSAAVCLAVAKDQADSESIRLKHRSPVSMRKACEPLVGEEVGLFASMSFFRGRVSSNDDFWELARAIRAQIKTHINTQTPSLMVRLLPWLSQRFGGDRVSDKVFRARWRKRIPSNSALTNAGIITFDSGGDAIKIESLRFAVSPGMAGDFTVGVNIFGETLHLGFTFSAQVFSRERAERFASDVLSRLRQAVSE